MQGSRAQERSGGGGGGGGEREHFRQELHAEHTRMIEEEEG